MKGIRKLGAVAVLLATVLLAAPPASAATGWTLVGWNDLGMHCMDKDFQVFAILPPYNTIHAQLIDPSGNRVTTLNGITVTYEAVADPDGSINTTSAAKTNFWDYVQALFKANLATDQGLVGFDMPGLANTPRLMKFDTGLDWFTAEGIPLTPIDNAGNTNSYPMMRLTARDSSGNVLATTDIVLPISTEMTCRACHSSGSAPAAEPSAGWVYHADPELDYRLNILLLHDEYQSGSQLYTDALAARGYNPLGLYASATSDHRPALCADCHGSNALPGTGYTGIEPLTTAIHSRHAGAMDPATGTTLGSSSNRAACYNCHPGSATRCLRGAMGHAVAPSGELAIQCQSCHGGMAMVGDSNRQGWFDEPNCQACHTGTATKNAGQIRFTDAFDSSGNLRKPADTIFATQPNTPAPGISLFRFSAGHGGLQCEACHGSTHAIFPSAHRNDNIQSTELQGHVGTLVECTTCHGTDPATTSGGPHGMHPVGAAWVSRHGDAAEGSSAACQACHGGDYRGTVLSRSHANRLISTSFGTKNFWRGFQIGCYTCHNGPSSESANRNQAPSVRDLSGSTTDTASLPFQLVASDPDGNPLQLRIVSQPDHGTVGLSGSQATYIPEAGFGGTTTFTYAAWDGSTDSNLGTVTVKVSSSGPPTCTVTCSASAPTTATAGSALAFSGSATASSCAGSVSYLWDFGDGSTSTQQNPTHTYAAAGTFTWTLTASASGVSCSKSGSVQVAAQTTCTVSCSATAPTSATTGALLAFNASANATDCAGSVSYQWNFGDGSTSSQQNPSHAYASAGAYTWTMTAAADGVTCSKSGTVTVTAPASCTIACSAEVATTTTAGSRVQFQGHAQTSNCASNPAFRWDFGDGSSPVTGADVTHRYRYPGTYTWKLVVTANGSSCESTGTILVSGSTRELIRHH